MNIRWGIVGAGIIAGKMADALGQVDGCELRAVASRTPGKAEAFAARFGGEAHGDYAALMTREDIDIVYVATTHNFHCANASQALLAGKHVLVEKPFTATGEEALQIRELARRHGRFCMEAMWTRFLPSTARLIEVVRSGRIGAIRRMTLTFGGSRQGSSAPACSIPRLRAALHSTWGYTRSRWPIS